MTARVEFLNKLREKRADAKKALESYALGGIKERISDLYDDNAHFIYELIQNADDSQASKITFILTKNGLYILHNGNDFSITDPDTEEQDKLEGKKVGDLNSILAIGNSNKTFEGNKIGKFGCGFKSVFRYCDNAYIFNKDINIKIISQIYFDICSTELVDTFKSDVLNNLKMHFDEANEILASITTIFYLEFKNDDKRIIYEEILAKFNNLVTPGLFLENLKVIDFIRYQKKVSYSKSEELIKICQDKSHNISMPDLTIEVSKVQYKDPLKTYNFWKFSRDVKGLKKYSVLFKTSENFDCLESIRNNPSFNNIFCYFASRKTHMFDFIMQGAFEMTPSRAELKQTEHNMKLYRAIISLAVDAIPLLKDEKAYGDEIAEFISNITKDDALKSKMSIIATENNLLPTEHKTYVSLDKAYFFNEHNLEFIDDNEIRNIYKNDEMQFVFRSLSKSKFDELFRNFEAFKNIKIELTNIAHKISAEYLQEKLDSNPQFLENLYKIADKSNTFDSTPFLFTASNEWLSKESGVEIYLNGDADSEYKVINKRILDISPDVKEIMSKWLKTFDLKCQIQLDIDKFSKGKISADDLFILCFEQYLKNANNIDFFKDNILEYYKSESIIRALDEKFYKASNFINFKNDFWKSIYLENKICDFDYYVNLLTNRFSGSLDEPLPSKLALFFDLILPKGDYHSNSYKLLNYNDQCNIFSMINSIEIYKTVNPNNRHFGIWSHLDLYKISSIVGIQKYIVNIFNNLNDIDICKENSLKLFSVLKYFVIHEPENLMKLFYSTVSFGNRNHQTQQRDPSYLSMLPLFFNTEGKILIPFIKRYDKSKFKELFDRNNKYQEEQFNNIFDFESEYSLNNFNEMYQINELNEEQLKLLSEFLNIEFKPSKLELQKNVLDKFRDSGVKSVEIPELINNIFDVVPEGLNIKNVIDDIRTFIQQKYFQPNDGQLGQGNNCVLHNTDGFLEQSEGCITDNFDNGLFNRFDSFESNAKQHELTFGFSNGEHLSQDERNRTNQLFTQQAKPELEHLGYDFSGAKSSINIYRNVSLKGQLFTICFKSCKNGILHMNKYEMEAMNEAKQNFMIMIDYKGKRKLISYNDIWRTNEQLTFSCPTKDAEDSQMNILIDSIMSFKDATINFEIEAILRDRFESNSSFLELDTYDKDYVNTTTDSDDDI